MRNVVGTACDVSDWVYNASNILLFTLSCQTVLLITKMQRLHYNHNISPRQITCNLDVNTYPWSIQLRCYVWLDCDIRQRQQGSMSRDV